MNRFNVHRLAAMTVAMVLGTFPSFAFQPIITLQGERPTIHPPGADIEVLASREQTDCQFGIIVINAKPGDGPGPAITNHRGSETWYVLEGQFEFHVADYMFSGGPDNGGNPAGADEAPATDVPAYLQESDPASPTE